MKRKNLFSRVLPLMICFMLLINLVVIPSDVSAISNPAKVEIVLAADPNSNNLSLDSFSDDFKNDILTRYGIPSDQVFITSIVSEKFDATKIDWHEFDHTNNASVVESTPKKLIVYDEEPYSNLIRDRHIVFSNEGRTIDFYGYGQEPYRDFLFTPDSNANNKDFTFTMNEAAVSYHTLKHGGFLFNAKYTYDEDTGERYVSGFYVGIAQSSVFLYQIDNMTVADLMAGVGEATINYVDQATWDSYLLSYTEEELHSWGYYLEGTGPTGEAFKQLQAFSKPASVGGYRYLKLVASPTHVSLYQFTDNTYSTTTTGGKIIDNYELPQNYGAFGFGPFAAYASHGCSELTQLTFSDLSLSTNSSTSFTDLIRSINWKYEDSMKLVVNVDNDGVEAFGNTADLGTILYYMGLNNAHYVGWGINNTISIGSDTSVIGQAESFIQRNLGKGTTINRSVPESDSLAEGITSLADYIYDNLPPATPIDPPNTKLTFGSDGAIQIDVTDEETSAGNPIGAYEWRYMDIATGVWMTSSSETATASFNFASGSYNMVAVKIQDAVSSLWSDYTIAYIANDTNAPPVARFTLTRLSAKSFNSANLSYHPAGEALTGYEWKVYDGSLTEVPAIASSAENPQFNFSALADGNYTIRLRVCKGEIWSSVFSQAVTAALEPQSIDFPELTGKTYGDASFSAGATASSGLPVQYSSSNPSVADVVDGKIVIYAAGSTKITASQAGSEAYAAAEQVERTLEVAKKSLVITAADKSKVVGQSDPELTAVFSGLADGDTAEVVSGLSLNRTAGEDIGQYTIQASGAEADNYDITYVDGKLTILGIYTITFDSNGGSPVASITQAQGSAITPPAEPTRTGYIFAGWYPALPSTMPQNGASLKATWVMIKVESDTVEIDEVEGLDDSVDLSEELEEGNDVDVILEVNLLGNNEVPAADKAKVDALIAGEPKPELVKALYLDVSLFKVIGSEKESIHQTSGLITISILVPEEHRGGTNYRIVRIHNGVVEYLTADYDPTTHILTFETDRFSTYALLYDLNNTAIPQTGENGSPWSAVAGILLLLAAGFIGLYLKKRKGHNEQI